LEYHTELAYQSFIGGFQEEGEEDEFDEVRVYVLNPEYVPARRSVRFSEIVDVMESKEELESKEEELESKQEEVDEHELMDKVVPITFTELSFTVEAQGGLAVTPTLPTTFGEDAESPDTSPMMTGEQEDKDSELNKEGELLKALLQSAASQLDVKKDPAQAQSLLDKQLEARTEESESGVSSCDDDMKETEESSDVKEDEDRTETEVPKYISQFVKTDRDCVQTQLNYIRFLQGFDIEETEACEDIKCQ